MILVMMLAFSSPAMFSRVHGFGTLIKTVVTVDGTLKVYRDGEGCLVEFRGQVVDRVSMATCSA